MSEHRYDAATAAAVEARWQTRWDAEGAHQADTAVPDDARTFLVLDMFPFPSGAGLHVGHPLGYVATDVAARYARMPTGFRPGRGRRGSRRRGRRATP